MGYLYGQLTCSTNLFGQLSIAWSRGSLVVQVDLGSLQHRNILFNAERIEDDHSRSSSLSYDIGGLIGSSHKGFELSEEVVAVTSKKKSRSFNKSLGVDNIVDKEVEQFEEFVIRNTIINLLLDALEENDFHLTG